MDRFWNIILLDGRDYANQIREKQIIERKWWEKLYLWFHDNFEMIMIAGGCILLAILIYSYMDSGNKCSINKNIQRGGDPDKGTSSNSESPTPTETTLPDKPIFVPKTESQIRSEAKIEAAKKKAEAILAGTAEPDKTTNQKMKSKFLSKRAEKNISTAKEAIKNAPGKVIGAVAGKSAAAWQSVKSGVALEKGKEKFEDTMANAEDFIKNHSKAGYALAFTTFMVIGFGLFFVPTLIMFVIGALTLMIFNKQKIQFLSNI